MLEPSETAGAKRLDLRFANLNPELYIGRGQTFAKHVLLRQYLQELAFKVLQSPNAPNDFLYVDGFSGPWHSQGQKIEDTSFSIALSVLTDVQGMLAAKNRFPKIRAVFVEKRAHAFARLQHEISKFPHVEVLPIHGLFEDNVCQITKLVRPSTFLFAFLDPCGWKGIALRRIAPLISHRPGEVLVNLMTNSLVRHVTFDGVRSSASELFGGGEWRAELSAEEARLGDREDAIVKVYLRRLKEIGRFNYVATTRIRNPDAARTYFHLAYGTRHPSGMEVFRRSEKRCIAVQERAVIEAYYDRRERTIGVNDLFREIGDDGSVAAFSTWKRQAQAAAMKDFESWLIGGIPKQASQWRATLMQHPYVDAPLVNGWAREAAENGRLTKEPNDRDEIWTPTTRL